MKTSRDEFSRSTAMQRDYADIASMRRFAGQSVALAISRSRGMEVATRNLRDFDKMGI